MAIAAIRLHNVDGTARRFVPADTALKGVPTPNTFVHVENEDGTGQNFVPSEEVSAFREGDLVRNTGIFGPRRGAIGVVRCMGTPATQVGVGRGAIGGTPATQVGVEWAAWKEGHDLEGKTRHHRNSGWFVSPADIEYAV